MASHQSIGSGSSSKSGKSSSMGQQVLCYHNQIAPLRTVKYDGPTKGKRFYGCSYWPKVKRLKAKKEKLQDEVGEMGIATTETLFEMKENNTDKKLMLTLVFSWPFLTLVLLMK
ncbi:Protein ZGRF1 [Bienertia sinuspersici]